MRQYIYLLKIKVGPKKLDSIVINMNKVPESLLKTMALEIIDTYIKTTFNRYNGEAPNDRIKNLYKESEFSIENMSELSVYELNLNFRKETIKNPKRYVKKGNTRESRL